MTQDANGQDFDLLGLVRSVTDGSGLRGPREIAAKVAENVPARQRLAALEQALIPYVREFLTRARSVAPVTPIQAGPRNRNSANSSRVSAIREAWRKTLTGQFHVGHGQWSVLADCSFDAVMFIAGERRENARRNAAAADMFERLADAVQAASADRVGDLPEWVLAEILTVEVAA